MYYSEQEARKIVIRAGLRLLESGLIARTWGNISARISEDEFIITPSGLAYETLKEEQLVKVKVSDLSYEGNIKPSSEKGIHAEAYRLRPQAQFVIHTHQFYATAVGVTGKDPGLDYAKTAKYGMPSTGKLKKACADVIRDNPMCNAVLMTRHGALCIGGSYDEAFEIAGRLEEDCKKIYYRVTGLSEVSDEIKLVAAKGKTLHPAIDDLVQIAGVSIKCVNSASDVKNAEKALKGRNAILIKGERCICTGKDKEAVEMILRKGCAAALYQGSLKGMNPVDAFIQRTIYVKKYSKKAGK